MLDVFYYFCMFSTIFWFDFNNFIVIYMKYYIFTGVCMWFLIVLYVFVLFLSDLHVIYSKIMVMIWFFQDMVYSIDVFLLFCMLLLKCIRFICGKCKETLTFLENFWGYVRCILLFLYVLHVFTWKFYKFLYYMSFMSINIYVLYICMSFIYVLHVYYFIWFTCHLFKNHGYDMIFRDICYSIDVFLLNLGCFVEMLYVLFG